MPGGILIKPFFLFFQLQRIGGWTWPEATACCPQFLSVTSTHADLQKLHGLWFLWYNPTSQSVLDSKYGVSGIAIPLLSRGDQNAFPDYPNPNELPPNTMKNIYLSRTIHQWFLGDINLFNNNLITGYVVTLYRSRYVPSLFYAARYTLSNENKRGRYLLNWSRSPCKEPASRHWALSTALSPAFPSALGILQLLIQTVGLG